MKISNQIYTQIKRLNSSSAKNQEEQNLVNIQLNENQQLLHSSLSSKLKGIESEVSSLESSVSDSENGVNALLGCAAISFIVAILAEVIASIIVIFLLIFVFIGGLFSGFSGG